MSVNIRLPVTLISINALCPTKSSQNWCPNIIKMLFDQSRRPRERVLQVKSCNSSEMQHLSVYVPDPSHLFDPEQFPNDHPKSDVLLYMETSKHLDAGSDVRKRIHFWKLCVFPKQPIISFVMVGKDILTYCMLFSCKYSLYQIPR